MIDHTGIGVANVARTAAFYDAALGALGLHRVTQLQVNDRADGVGYGIAYPVFWIDRFHPHGVKQHTAFTAKNRAEVDAFHAAALKAGGVDNGPPAFATSPMVIRRATTPPLCSTRMATTWRRSSAKPGPSAYIVARRTPTLRRPMLSRLSSGPREIDVTTNGHTYAAVNGSSPAAIPESGVSLVGRNNTVLAANRGPYSSSAPGTKILDAGANIGHGPPCRPTCSIIRSSS